jgi:hypothetical protein
MAPPLGCIDIYIIGGTMSLIIQFSSLLVVMILSAALEAVLDEAVELVEAAEGGAAHTIASPAEITSSLTA